MAVFTREALYELVWTDSVREISTRIGVSDTRIRTCCAEADVPVPDRGYWTKLRAGKIVVRRPLPPRGLGKSSRIVFGRDGYRPVDPEKELAEPDPVEPRFEEPIETVEERVRKAVRPVPHRRDLNSPHGLIKDLLDQDEVRRLKPPGAPWRLTYSKPLFDSPFERRRMRVLNSVFLALTREGHKPWVRGDDARDIGVGIGDTSVSFSVDHPDAKPKPNGGTQIREGEVDALSLTIPALKLTWSDDVESGLGAKLTDVVAKLIVTGEVLARKREESDFEYACNHRRQMAAEIQRRANEAARLEREKREKLEKEQLESLLTMATDYRKAEDIRAFVRAAVDRHSNENAPNPHLDDWADWALQIADRTDPISKLSFEPDAQPIS